MTPTQREIEEFQNLERIAGTLLSEIAASPRLASGDSLHALDRIAGRAAKIAYGTGSSEMVSDQMRNLIAWTDHLDDPSWVARFQRALGTQPLVSPFDNVA